VNTYPLTSVYTNYFKYYSLDLYNKGETMKKLTSLILVFCLIFGGIGAVAYQKTETNGQFLTTVKLNTSQINFEEKGTEYLQISFSENENFLLSPGKPILPKIIQTYEIPFGATNIEVNVKTQNVYTKTIEKQIQPSPAPLPLSPIDTMQKRVGKDIELYQSNNPFPSQWYDFNVGVGVNEHFEHVTFVTVHLYPIQYTPAKNLITVAETAEIDISYEVPDTNPFPLTSAYDLVIITPSSFSDALQPFIDHKNSYGVETFIKNTEEIYDEYDGIDEAEQIKYFIKDAIETLDIKYVLLVGGLKSTIYGKPKDNANIGSSGWHVPVRYSNVRASGDPGFISDLYYADIYKEGGEFDNWDSDGDGILAEWYAIEGTYDAEEFPEDIIDYAPDVAVGRLACSDAKEVTDLVNKIISYETTTYGQDWFKKMVAYSGDGFLDQFDLNIQWDTSEITDGEYTICAQSFNDEDEEGPIDEIHVTVDKTVASNITFNHDDHLNPVFENGYPAPPIAEIVSVSEGNTIGNTDVEYEPSEGLAYCNTLFWWANISYVDEVLTIRGKSYDPKPYGNLTSIHVWVENNEGEVVFSDWRHDLLQYYEGEWVTGAEEENGRGGALYYMPEDFDKEIVWCSKGNFNGPDDIISSFSEGWGFAFFSGHGSPGYWGDQYPGIPGNRQFGSVHGLVVSNIQTRPPFITDKPLWPMKELANTNQLPVTVVGGCHNSQFNVSLFTSAMDLWILILTGRQLGMWTYGSLVPQCWSWYMVQLPNTGSIATIGNTGLGWGWEGEFCTIGAGDGWISSEFFRTYGDHYGQEEFETLGQVYQQTQTSYVNTFKDYTLSECWWFPDFGWDSIDAQAVQQWVLLGDPSLKIGGYE